LIHVPIPFKKNEIYSFIHSSKKESILGIVPLGTHSLTTLQGYASTESRDKSKDMKADYHGPSL